MRQFPFGEGLRVNFGGGQPTLFTLQNCMFWGCFWSLGGWAESAALSGRVLLTRLSNELLRPKWHLALMLLAIQVGALGRLSTALDSD